MKDSLTKFKSKLAPIIDALTQYRLLVMFIIVLLLYSFLIFRINTLNHKAPSEVDLSNKLQTVARPHIDQSVVDKIKQLNDNSVQVKTLFNNTRSNPFHE